MKLKLTVTIVIGLVTIYLFYIWYGFDMLRRYILGAILFATVTVVVIKWINKNGKRRLL